MKLDHVTNHRFVLHICLNIDWTTARATSHAGSTTLVQSTKSPIIPTDKAGPKQSITYQPRQKFSQRFYVAESFPEFDMPGATSWLLPFECHEWQSFSQNSAAATWSMDWLPNWQTLHLQPQKGRLLTHTSNRWLQASMPPPALLLPQAPINPQTPEELCE